MMRFMWMLAVAGMLAACGDNSPRYLLDGAAAPTQIRVPVRSIEMRQVTLPSYAAASEIVQQQPDGALRPVAKAVWADDPTGAVTRILARNLDAGTTAVAAAEPWPLDTPAQVRVEVRVDRMVAQLDGTFRMTGQFSVAAPLGAIRESITRFDIVQPITGEGPGEIAQASSAALSQLAQQIAQEIAG